MAPRSIFGPVGLLFGDFARARDAYANYEHLSQMSDAALARQGLKRTDISRVALKDVLSANQ
jgi:uncharacterized protein YjiS (DUF1127 family)